MWLKLDNKYYLNVVPSNAGDEVCITDFITLWSVTYNDDSFLECLRESNPHMSIEESDLYLAKYMLTIPTYLKTERTAVTERDGTLKVVLLGDKSRIGYPLHLKMSLTEGSKQMFYLLVTCNLLGAIHKLRASETELIRLLTKKDDEIAEYKCEGGEIALRHLKTVPFDKETHSKQFQCPLGHIPDPDCLPTRERPPKLVITNTKIKTEETATTDIPTEGSNTSNTMSDSIADIRTTMSDSVDDIRTKRCESVADIRTIKCESVAETRTTKSESVADIRTLKSESFADIRTTKPESVDDIRTVKSESDADIRATKSESVAKTRTTKSELVADIRTIKTEPSSQVVPSPRKKRIKLNI